MPVRGTMNDLMTFGTMHSHDSEKNIASFVAFNALVANEPEIERATIGDRERAFGNR